jgi:hypothetical protein
VIELKLVSTQVVPIPRLEPPGLFRPNGSFEQLGVPRVVSLECRPRPLRSHVSTTCVVDLVENDVVR